MPTPLHALVRVAEGRVCAEAPHATTRCLAVPLTRSPRPRALTGVRSLAAWAQAAQLVVYETTARTALQVWLRRSLERVVDGPTARTHATAPARHLGCLGMGSADQFQPSPPDGRAWENGRVWEDGWPVSAVPKLVIRSGRGLGDFPPQATLIFLFQLHVHRMLWALGEINKGLVHVPAMWGGMWEAHSLRTQAPQLQSRLDVNFKTQVGEWRRKDAAVRMQSCFRGRRVRRGAALRVPPEARDVVPPPPPDPPAPSPPPSGSPSEPADSTAEARAAVGAL